MKCISCFKNAKFIQKGTKLSFCNKKCQFNYISAGEKRKLEIDSNYVTIIATNGTEFKIERSLIGLADLEEFPTLPVPFDSDDLYLLFYADYSLLYKKKEKLIKLNEIADYLDFENGRLQDMEDLLNTGNFLEFVEIVSINFELYIQKAAFIVFTDFKDLIRRFDTENNVRFNVFNVSQYTLEIFESLTREDLFTLNLKPETLCELVYISVELGLREFYGQLMEYIYKNHKDIKDLIKSTNLKNDPRFINYNLEYYTTNEYLRLITMDGKVELLKEKHVLIIYNNLLKYLVRLLIKKFFIDQYFTAKYIADKLKYPQNVYEPVRNYQEGDEFRNLEYTIESIVLYQTKTILNLSDENITDLLLYLKLEEVPNYEYFVMGFRSSHPRLWKVVSLFMKQYML